MKSPLACNQGPAQALATAENRRSGTYKETAGEQMQEGEGSSGP